MIKPTQAKQVYLDYLNQKIREEDWHAVSDAANDLRVLVTKEENTQRSEEDSMFKSQAQRAKFAEMVKQGKMSQKTFDEWNSDTPKNIPDRIHTKAKTIKKVKKIKTIR